MCTALTLMGKDLYFGRTLDIDRSYGEEVCIMPHNFPMRFRHMGEVDRRLALIGMATVADGIPLFYDAANEHGLCMAGLNFPGNAYYPPLAEGKDNVASFELIPWILCQCRTVKEARRLLERINLCNTPFSDRMKPAPLHWILADRKEAIVVESMRDGLHVHENPVGVMTNNPPFDYQLFNLNNYRHLQVDNGEDHFAAGLTLDEYCQGLGGLGLPGDLSSMSRFVRIAFGRMNAISAEDENFQVSRFFHLLSTVEMTCGLCRTPEGHWDITVYTSCINAEKGLYYYTTYDNRRICCVSLHKTDLEAAVLSRFPPVTEQDIRLLN